MATISGLINTGTTTLNSTTTVKGPIYFGSAVGSEAYKPILVYSETYPQYGICYNNSSVDKLTFSASGNAGSAMADLCINGNGNGTVTIRGNNIWHAGNLTKLSQLTNDSGYVTSNHSHNYLGVGPTCIEMNTSGILKNYGGFIDFHFRNDNGDWVNSNGQVHTDANGNKTYPDYTSRIIENAPGQISVNDVKFKWGVVTVPSTGKFVGNLEGTATTATNLADKPSLQAGTVSTSKITVTAGGQTSNEFTVPYASTSYNTRYMTCPDTRTDAITPSAFTANSTGVSFDFKQKSVTGLSAAYSGVMTFRPYGSTSDWTGGPIHNLAFDQNGLHHRTAASDTWGAWKTLAYTDAIPTKVSQLTNDSGFVTGGPYLPLSGGALDDSAKLKLTLWGARTLTLSGNSIDLDMSLDTGTYAGAFATIKDAKQAVTTMLGFYGSYGNGLYHIFMGGTYDNPAMKMDPLGNFTFKNTITGTITNANTAGTALRLTSPYAYEDSS
jgi:hypothetical protein